MKMRSVDFYVAVLLGFGCTTLISANVEITSNGNNGKFLQGSEAILTCTINPYTGSQTWKVDGVSVADCGFLVCSENMSNPERYSFTPNISTETFVFTINPVDSADDGNIDCFDGSSTETFIMVVTEMEKPFDPPLGWCIITTGDESCIILICGCLFIVQCCFALTCICTICTTCKSSICKGSKDKTQGNTNGMELNQPNTRKAESKRLQTEMVKKINTKKHKCDALKQEIENTQKEHNNLQQEIKETKNEHEDLRLKIKDQREKLQAVVQRNTEEIEDEEEEDEYLHMMNIKEKRELIEYLRREIKENQNRYDGLHQKINENQKKYKDLQRKIEEKEKEYNDVQLEIKENQERYDDLQQKLKENQEKYDLLRQKEQKVACLIGIGFVPFLGIFTLIAAFCVRKNLCKTESQRANTRTW